MEETIKITPRYRINNNIKKERLNRRKTTEQYKEEVKNINPNIEVVGEYVLAKEKILHKCLICNTEWKTYSSNILKGHGCPECAKNTISNKLRKTTNEYVKELNKIRKDIVLVGEYLGANTKTEYKCVDCSYKFLATPANVLSGNNKCPVCFPNYKIKDEKLYDILLNKQFPNIVRKSDYIDSKSEMKYECTICGYKWSLKTANQIFYCKYGCSNCAQNINSKNRTKSDKQFKQELNSVNANIITTTSYIGANEIIFAKCLVCNNSWETTPSHLLRGDGCSKCAGNLKLTHEMFLDSIKNTIDKNILIIGQYNGANSPIDVECILCKRQWTSTPTSIRNGSGCKVCKDKINSINRRLAQEEFISRISRDILIRGDYVGANKPIECECLICGNVWIGNTSSLLNGSKCPHCNKSNGEDLIESYLKNNNIKYIHTQKYNGLIGVGGRHLSYDFYLPEYNLLIEFQGAQHEKPIKHFGGEKQFKKQQEHDKRKREYAKQNNINLLEIWYYDIDNIEEILTNTLNNLKLESLETATSA